MGQTLSSPDTEKHSKSGGDDRYIYGLSEMQGWRISMEDAHTIELRLSNNGGENAFFAVYDGHGGSTVAKYSGEHVHQRLIHETEYHEKRYTSALKKAFLGIDDDIRKDPSFFRDPSGCTAIVALVTYDRKIVVANAGDSRSVLSVKGVVKPLSFDHKPLNETEMTRIRNAGGYIEYGRVNGNLALSRAIGDFDFKKNNALTPEEQIITANPDVIEHEITGEDEFLVLACDGIWDCLTSQQVVDIIRLQISQRRELSEICEFICDHCLAPDTSSGAGVGCDNMTIMIVGLLNGRTKEQWYDWVKERVEKHTGYDTPSEIPQIYAPNRIAAFHARQHAHEGRRDRAHDRGHSGHNGIGAGGGGAFNFARTLLGTGIAFHPGTGSIVADDGTLMFAGDDSDEEDINESDDGDVDIDMDRRTLPSHAAFLAALGIRPPHGDVTRNLRAQLDEFEDSEGENAHVSDGEDSDTAQEHINFKESDDEDQLMSDPDDEAQQAFGARPQKASDSSGPAKPPPFTIGGSPNGSPVIPQEEGETPPPPAPLPNGNDKQLNSVPGGDEAPPAVKAEGLLDASEDPLKG